MHNSKIFILLIFVFHSTQLVAGSDEHHDHKHEESKFEEHTSHVHGHASAHISYENGILNINKTFSSADIFGFEHSPKNEKQKNAIELAVKNLKTTEMLFNFHEASCKLDTVLIEGDLINQDADNHEKHHHHEDEHHHDENSAEEAHTDVFANYLFKCDTRSLNSIEYLIFDIFPSIEKIEVEFIAHDQQSLFTATPSNRIHKLN